MTDYLDTLKKRYALKTKALDNKHPKITNMIKYRKKIKEKHNIIQLPTGTYRTFYYNRYKVQMRFWGIWLTIKEFDGDKDDWWANACADNLLDELNKN